jgi:hypothetical protein
MGETVPQKKRRLKVWPVDLAVYHSTHTQMEATPMRNVVLTLVFALVCATGTVQAQEAEERQTGNTLRAPAGAGPKASLADMGWLVGHWTGTGLGGVSEEIWSEPAAGAMMGMYRLIVGGKLVFYEFMNMVEENGSLALKLKHFNADLTGWEEKDRFVTFRLAKLTPTEAWFGGLTFRRVSNDRLEIFLALRGNDGNVREEVFHMERR